MCHFAACSAPHCLLRALVGGGGHQRDACLYRGAPCAVPALCEKEAVLDAFSPMATVTAVTTVFPYAGRLKFLLGPKKQSVSENKIRKLGMANSAQQNCAADALSHIPPPQCPVASLLAHTHEPSFLHVPWPKHTPISSTTPGHAWQSAPQAPVSHTHVPSPAAPSLHTPRPLQGVFAPPWHAVSQAAPAQPR